MRVPGLVGGTCLSFSSPSGDSRAVRASLPRKPRWRNARKTDACSAAGSSQAAPEESREPRTSVLLLPCPPCRRREEPTQYLGVPSVPAARRPCWLLRVCPPPPYIGSGAYGPPGIRGRLFVHPPHMVRCPDNLLPKSSLRSFYVTFFSSSSAPFFFLSIKSNKLCAPLPGPQLKLSCTCKNRSGSRLFGRATRRKNPLWRGGRRRGLRRECLGARENFASGGYKRG